MIWFVLKKTVDPSFGVVVGGPEAAVVLVYTEC